MRPSRARHRRRRRSLRRYPRHAAAKICARAIGTRGRDTRADEQNRGIRDRAVLVAVVVRASTFIVDQRQFAIVFQLGEIVRVVTQPGLYFKIPLLQNVEYQDSRILTIDTPQADRVQTSEKKNLLIDSFVRWRISEPRAFRVSFPGGERSAEERISTSGARRVEPGGQQTHGQ